MRGVCRWHGMHALYLNNLGLGDVAMSGQQLIPEDTINNFKKNCWDQF
jgi:hypothetical protein